MENDEETRIDKALRSYKSKILPGRRPLRAGGRNLKSQIVTNDSIGIKAGPGYPQCCKIGIIFVAGYQGCAGIVLTHHSDSLLFYSLYTETG